MFREIRRNKKQILSDEIVEKILHTSTSGVLNLLSEDGYTYGVPLSYCYNNNKLYFHSAKLGHKLDAIQNHDKVSFTIIETDQIIPEEYTTYFRSAIVFGKVRLANSEDEIKEAMSHLVKKYSPNFIEGGIEEINNKINALKVIVLDIEHISGKEAIEFANQR